MFMFFKQENYPIMEVLVAKYLNGDEQESKMRAVAEISKAVSSKSSTVLQMMESMQEYLTSTDLDKRVKPLELIASTLTSLHETCLTPAECSVLVEFLCCRLKDHFSLHPPTLDSLVILSSRSDLPVGTAEEILKVIFKEVHVPSYMQSSRRAVFDILSNLLDSYAEEIKKTGDEFVYGVITAVDGEQDPRNLLKVFDLMYSVVKHGFALSKYAEEFFEVVGCYFPIDFEPPTNLSENKKVVTNEELVIGLRKVLTSSPLFAPYCIPLMIEKIESDVKSAKIDASITLSQCLKIYSLSAVSNYLRPLWLCLKREILGSKYKDVEELAKGLLKDITALLSESPQQASSASSSLDLFVNDIVEECLPHITEHLQEKMAWASGNIMITAAEASKRACEKILSAMLPVLLKSLDKKGLMIAEKRLTMELIVSAVKASSIHNFEVDLDSHPLLQYKAEIVEIFCGCVVSQEFVHLRTVALAGAAALCNIGILITPEDQVTIVHSLIYCYQHEKDDMILKDLRITCGFLSSKWPDVALSHILPILKSQLSNIFERSGKERDNCLKTLCAISNKPEVTFIVCELIMSTATSTTIDEENSSMILDCLDAISTIVKGNINQRESFDYFTEGLVFPLVKTCVKLSLIPVLPEQCCTSCSGLQSFSSKCVTWPIMQKVSEIIRIICQNLKPGKLTDNILITICDIIVNSNTESLQMEIDKVSFNPFQNTKLPLQTRLVSLLTATYCTLRKDIDVPQLEEVREKLLVLCQETMDQPSYASASKCLAGLVNKYPDNPFIEKVYQVSGSVLFDESVSKERKIAVLSTVVWTTKALVIRSHSDTMKLCQILFKLFSDVDLGKMAADSFDIILRDSDEVLNESCHACIRLMHKQRFFQLVLPRLTSGFQNAEKQQSMKMEIDGEFDFSQTRANYLTALSHLLRYIPKQVLNQHLSSLLPLLIKSLNSGEGPLLVSVLSTIYNLMQEAKSSIEPHIDMLLNKFMSLAVFESSMHVRMQALKCIGATTLLSVNVVLPYKKRIVRELSAMLDDKKRLVRREAVNARTEWCLLGDA